MFMFTDCAVVWSVLLSLYSKVLRMTCVVETRSDSGHLRGIGIGTRKNNLTYTDMLGCADGLLEPCEVWCFCTSKQVSLF